MKEAPQRHAHRKSTPFILINFKTYANATGTHAIALAKICEEVAKGKKAHVAIAVQAVDLASVSAAVDIPVFAQHADASVQGQSTGSITVEALKAAGAQGTLINHSERKIPLEAIQAIVERCRAAGLKTVVCAENPDMAYKVAQFKPDYVAMEPPELIGGDISVSTAKPELIGWSRQAVHDGNPDTALLVGAGVKNNADLKKSLELGAQGILLASGITKTDDPKKALLNLMGD